MTTQKQSLKIKHLAANPFVSLAYIAEPFKPVYVECEAVWEGDLAMRRQEAVATQHTRTAGL